MKTLDRYILREFFKIFLLIMVSLVFIYLTVDFFERIRMLLSNNATLKQITSYFLFGIPMVVSQMLPVSVLLATLLTFSLLSKNNEIVAMKANGISLYRVSLPLLIISVGICIVLFCFSEFITPYTNQKVKHIKLVEIQKRKMLGSFTQNQIWYKSENAIYNFSVFDPETGTLKGIQIHYLDKEMNLTKRIDARTAYWNNGQWVFHDLLITIFPKNSFPILERLETKAISLPEEPPDFTIVQKNTEEMGFLELKRFVDKIQSEGYDATRYIVDMHGKVAFSMVNIILVILGISFSFSKTERGGSIAKGVGAGIIIGFSYWLVYAFTISLGRSATIPPLLAAWMANIIFSIIALVMFFRVKT